MQTCPMLERLVIDLHKSREIANKHLANLRHANKKIGVLETEIETLELEIRRLNAFTKRMIR